MKTVSKTRSTRKPTRAVMFPGICSDAYALGVNQTSLWRCLTGRWNLPKLEERYRALKRAQAAAAVTRAETGSSGVRCHVGLAPGGVSPNPVVLAAAVDGTAAAHHPVEPADVVAELGELAPQEQGATGATDDAKDGGLQGGIDGLAGYGVANP